jgi:serine/threonine protein kinase
VQKRSTTLAGTDTVSELDPAGTGLYPGDHVGPYRLLRLLGSGGMAEVWLAQRTDGTFQREVALKVPMLARPRGDLARRFAREREILAALEHPNIARMYDAGISGTGLPYLVMECVRGESLTAWCDAHCSTVRERLRLFLQVLQAVQYAHEQHVIHRDIKPANILVTDAGQVRLLDFGVAKLLTQDDEQAELTRWYGRPLTPEYASPELVRGDAIDAGADVYSLGIVLYELLCGSRPYRVKTGSSIDRLERMITTARIERPSTRVGPEAGSARGATRGELVRQLRGDLDAIVLKALAKSVDSRYRSAVELTHEVQRYLSGEPVEARRTPVLHRLGTLFLRRRAGSWSSISIAVLPFLDMSSEKDQECFSDGLTDELISHLTRSPGLRVIARTSSFCFKGRQVTIAQIAKTLRVSCVLEGSVRKCGSALRVIARLTDVQGSHLWSQAYDRTLGDPLRLQEEIARNVAQELTAALLCGGPTAPGPSLGSLPVSDVPTLMTRLASFVRTPRPCD